MKTPLFLATIMGSALLSACSGQQRTPYETGRREPISLRDEGDLCGASLVQNFLGLRANDTLRQEIATRSEARSIRWLTPGMAVTMDFRGDRLNATLDEDGVITALRCG
jgi:nitrous oxide reductase accessory protein NosL